MESTRKTPVAQQFSPAMSTIKEKLSAGKLGAPGLLRVHRWRPRSTLDVIQNELTPAVDLAIWLFEHVPTSIFAVRRGGGASGDCEHLHVHLGFPAGGMALIDLAALPANATPYSSTMLIGSSGAAYADDHHNMHLLYRAGRPEAVPADQCPIRRISELQPFVDRAAEVCEDENRLGDSRACLTIKEAIGRSAETGTALQWMEGRYEFV